MKCVPYKKRVINSRLEKYYFMKANADLNFTASPHQKKLNQNSSAESLSVLKIKLQNLDTYEWHSTPKPVTVKQVRNNFISPFILFLPQATSPHLVNTRILKSLARQRHAELLITLGKCQAIIAQLAISACLLCEGRVPCQRFLWQAHYNVNLWALGILSGLS